MNELHGVPEAEIDIYLVIREAVCDKVCGRGRGCMDMRCVELMLRLAGRIAEVADNERAD